MSFYSDNTYNTSDTNNAWNKIFQFVKPNSKILDIGCSSGNLGQALKKNKNVQVIGIDIDQNDVNLAKNNLDDAFLLNVEDDDLNHLGQFDIVIMADVIEHLLNPVNALQKVKKILKKDGQLIFSIPNMANVTTRLQLLKGRFEYTDTGILDRTHLHFYDKKEIDRIFALAGFQIKTTDSTIRNIPKEMLKKELEEFGIKLTHKLFEYFTQPEALAYQYIGYAKVSNSRSIKNFALESSSPLDITDRAIKLLHNNYQQAIRSKEEEIADLHKKYQKIIASTERDTKNIHAEYQKVISNMEKDAKNAHDEYRKAIEANNQDLKKAKSQFHEIIGSKSRKIITKIHNMKGRLNGKDI